MSRDIADHICPSTDCQFPTVLLIYSLFEILPEQCKDLNSSSVTDVLVLLRLRSYAIFNSSPYSKYMHTTPQSEALGVVEDKV